MPQNDPPEGARPLPDPVALPDGHAVVLRDYRLLAGMRSPVRHALWLALLRSSEELMSRESLLTTTPDPLTKHPELTSIPAVIAWAEAAVRKGIRGDMQAWSLVADRIEGKTGTRKDEVDPEDERRRGDIQATIEAVVGSLVNNRLANPSDAALDITPLDNSPHDTHRQDSDTARRTEIAEAARREQADNQARGETLAETNVTPEERDLTDPFDPRRPNGHDH